MRPLAFFYVFITHFILAEGSRICNPGGSNDDFTGFMVEFRRDYDLTNPFNSGVHALIRCKGGERISEVTVDAHFPFPEFPWATPLCPNGGSECYQMARMKKVKTGVLFRAFPFGRQIGGLFKVANEEATSDKLESFTPVAPLIQESLFNIWFEHGVTESGLPLYHIPMYYTPVIPEDKASSPGVFDKYPKWYKKVSAIENYKYDGPGAKLLNAAREESTALIISSFKKSGKMLKKLLVKSNDSEQPKIAGKPSSQRSFLFPKIFKSDIEVLASQEIKQESLNFNSMIILSKILPKDKYEDVLNSIEEIYSKVPVPEETFYYPNLLNQTTTSKPTNQRKSS